MSSAKEWEMSWEAEALKRAIEQALDLLAEQRGLALKTAVSPFIYTNLDKGRVHNYLERPDSSPADYVWRVADQYEQWHDYLCAVQIEKRDDVWQPLYKKLQTWAFRFLPRIGYPTYASRDDHIQQAHACAAKAALTLITACFPYDTNFDPWAYVILQNVTHKHMNRQIKPLLKSQQQEIELDAYDDWLQNLLDPAGGESQRMVELRADLLQAINQLSSKARKQFILLYYFEQKSFEEIAVRMDKSLNALYKLHSDALENLRKILDENRDNE
jgi:RNA polymerase sigma factor (sigma-70 family)